MTELLIGLGVGDEGFDELAGVRIVASHRIVEVVDRPACFDVAGVLRHLEQLVAGIVGVKELRCADLR